MRWRYFPGVLGAVTLAVMLTHAEPQNTPTKKKTAKPPTASKGAKKPVAAPSAKGKKTKGSHSGRKAAGPSYQLHPDPGRYAEIQRALTERGYFHGEANG